MTSQNCNYSLSFPNNLDLQANTKILNCNFVQLRRSSEHTLHSCIFLFLIATNMFSPNHVSHIPSYGTNIHRDTDNKNPQQAVQLVPHCIRSYYNSAFCHYRCYLLTMLLLTSSPPQSRLIQPSIRRFGSLSQSPHTQRRILLQ
jgi:hypothetical protein